MTSPTCFCCSLSNEAFYHWIQSADFPNNPKPTPANPIPFVYDNTPKAYEYWLKTGDLLYNPNPIYSSESQTKTFGGFINSLLTRNNPNGFYLPDVHLALDYFETAANAPFFKNFNKSELENIRSILKKACEQVGVIPPIALEYKLFAPYVYFDPRKKV